LFTTWSSVQFLADFFIIANGFNQSGMNTKLLCFLHGN
jgi:hypothetical protein